MHHNYYCHIKGKQGKGYSIFKSDGGGLENNMGRFFKVIWYVGEGSSSVMLNLKCAGVCVCGGGGANQFRGRVKFPKETF